MYLTYLDPSALSAPATSPGITQPLWVRFPFQCLSCIYNRGDSHERNEWFRLPFIQRTARSQVVSDGYKQLPRAGHMNVALQHITGGGFALNYVGAQAQKKKTGFQWRRNIVYLSGVFKVFLEKQRLAYIKVAHKKLLIILNMKICQELHAKWICIYQSCTYSTQLSILNYIKNGNTEVLDADNWMVEKHTQTCTQLWHLFHLSYLDS